MRARQDEPPESGLARFAGSVLTQPDVFGGGAVRASATRRRDTVAYGYLGVLEQYAAPDSAERWRVLTVTLPGQVPGLVVDHRSVLGRPGVPGLDSPGVPTGDPAFDALYLVHAGDSTLVSRVLTPAVRQLLVGLPVQRFALAGRALLLRTFDDAPPESGERLTWLAGSILGSAPSFVSAAGWGGGTSAGDAPLLPGRYGEDDTAPTAEELGRARSRRIAAVLVAVAALVVVVAAVVVALA